MTNEYFEAAFADYEALFNQLEEIRSLPEVPLGTKDDYDELFAQLEEIQSLPEVQSRTFRCSGTSTFAGRFTLWMIVRGGGIQLTY
jgi:hypothetical protein